MDQSELPISPVVFQVLLFSLVPLNLIIIVIFIQRKHLFPIAQRIPNLVIFQLVTLVILQILYLSLPAAFPSDRFLSNCKVFHTLSAFFGNLVVLLFAYRIAILFMKDFVTKILVREQRMLLATTSALTRRDISIAEYEVVNPLFKTMEYIISAVTKRMNFYQAALILISPSVCLSISAFLFASLNGTAFSFSVWTEKTCDDSFPISLPLQIASNSYLGLLLMLTIFSIFSIQDNFCIGHEIKGVLLITLFLMIPNILTLFQSLRTSVLIEAWSISIGAVFVTGVYLIQAVYPIFLSFEFNQLLKSRRTIEALELEGGDKEVSSSETALLPSPKNSVEGLLQVLGSKKCRSKFLKFLEKELSVENLLFYDACVQFAKDFEFEVDQKSEILESARRIIKTYLDNSAVHMVNISHVTRTQVLKKFNEINNAASGKDAKPELQHGLINAANLFEQAQREALLLMARDSFMRFQLTADYVDCRKWLTAKPDPPTSKSRSRSFRQLID
jgi:hypothetical protein